ncbi:ArsR/SmtB family transcription factor [Salibacterium aidingense]|uniref:ArsR/SmtB family transcription factor n=1 Tax=Salibacterium aidingense TaxID=384933 RepID=UPI003BE050B5
MFELSIERKQEMRIVAHALASDIRLSIIELLNQKNYNVNELSEALAIPISTTAANVKVLEEAGLVTGELSPGARGTMKVCKRMFDDMHVVLNNQIKDQGLTDSYEIDMPIGHYVNCEASPTCGVAGANGQLLVNENEPGEFFSPERMEAQLIWLRKGFLEYRFPYKIPENAEVESIEISGEICSEAPNYDLDWPSDITFWINGIELGTWTSPGDFGNRRGKYTPSLWSSNSTQYGIRKVWKIDHQGTLLDDHPLSEASLFDLDLQNRHPLSVKIGIKKEAVHQGGLNLFGKHFGDFDQNLRMTVFYTS